MPDSLGKKIKLRQKMLEEEKNWYETRDYDIARYVNPRRELIRDSQRLDDKGASRGKMAYSGEPSSALGIWTDGMQGHLVSQSLRWFKSIFGVPSINDIDEVQKYLQRYDEAMYGEFNSSNFYAVLPEWFRDAGSVGTATLYTEEVLGKGLAVMTVIHPREIFIAEDRYGNVDTVHRKFFLTARQAVDMFGDDRLNQSILDNAERHPEKRHEFLHAVFPNKERMFGSLLSTDKAISSVYLQKDGKPDVEDGEVVRESGYDINPYTVWRLRKNSDEIYGYSPAADAMVSIKKINQIAKNLLKASHLAVSPALNVPEHMRGNTEIMPDGHNYYDKSKDIITTINTSNNYPVAIDREDKIQRIIEDKYRVEFFLVLARSEREMTATEIMERQAEKSVLLGPQVDRLEKEGIGNTFDIVSDLADKGGRLPEPPQILIDAIEEEKASGRKTPDIKIRLIGPLAQAQRRLFQMQPIKNGLNELAQASVLYPEVLDIVDPNKLGEKIADSTNMPQDIMRTDTELAEFQETRAREQQEAQQKQDLMGMADAYPKISKAPDEGSPAELIGQQIA